MDTVCSASSFSLALFSLAKFMDLLSKKGIWFIYIFIKESSGKACTAFIIYELILTGNIGLNLTPVLTLASELELQNNCI